MMDVVEHAEWVEAELSRFIERRADKIPKTDTTEESYMQSVRRYHVRLKQDELRELARFHRRQLENHRAPFREIIRRHKDGLAEGEQALGITNVQGDDAA